MVVYLDVLLLENFLINLFLLRTTVQTIKKRTSALRLIISAIFGSLYVVTVVIPWLEIFTAAPFKIAMAFVMIFIVLGHRDLFALVKGSFIFILYSMLLAGVAFYLAIQDNPALTSESVIYSFSYKNIILALMILYLVVNRIVMYVKERKQLTSYIYNIEVSINGIKTKVKTFLDTGNELREPVTNLPVIIVEKRLFEEMNLESNNTYTIPFSVVSGYGGNLIGIKPDNIKIDIDGNLKEEKAILAFSDKKLSKHNDYNGLLPRGIIE